MTNDNNLANPEEPNRSYKYLQIFTELKEWRGGAYNIAKRLFEQGEADGLPYPVIRKDIVDVLSGVVSSRQLLRALPDPLKRSGGYNTNPRNDIMSIQKTPAQQAIEFKNRMSQEPEPTKQLASDSISKVITVQPPQPEPERQPSAVFKEIEAVDESVVWQSIPEDYKIKQLDNYEKPYLVKIAKYQHERIQQLEEQVRELTKDVATRKQISMNDEDRIIRMKVQLKRAGIIPSRTVHIHC